MKIKTSELQGVALDWAVEATKEVQFGEGRVVKICRLEPTTPAWIEVENSPGSAPAFHRSSCSTNWAQGGPIIEREKFDVRAPTFHCEHWTVWAGNYSGVHQQGSTPLIAAMRCYVASKLGDEVEIPNELMGS